MKFDYSIIATGDGMKLEQWGDVCLLRPDPQVIWPSSFKLSEYDRLNSIYVKDGGGGAWNTIRPHVNEWIVNINDLKFSIKLMGFKHTGLFPEQACNWNKLSKIIRNVKTSQKPRVLNLFAYTGGASIAMAKAGAFVTHVDAASNMVERARQNAILNDLPNDSIRYIVDDCLKFVQREYKRGKVYDAVIMDPPCFGRGPNGEVWKLEENLYKLCDLVKKILMPNPLFVLINSYTTGIQPTVLQNIVNKTMNDKDGKSESYELTLTTLEKGVLLPCGASGLWVGGKHDG